MSKKKAIEFLIYDFSTRIVEANGFENKDDLLIAKALKLNKLLSEYLPTAPKKYKRGVFFKQE